MINYYEYETSPRKEEPEITPSKRKKRQKTVENREDIRKKIRKAQVIEARKNVKNIILIGLAFVLLLTISYRYALINSRFSEKEKNINNIEQAAKEKLGMQKLNNNQKVYVNLQKKDYVETSNNAEEEVQETWWQKLLKTLKGE